MKIAETMGCGTNLAIRILKELDDENGVGLIHKKRRGFGLPTLIMVGLYQSFRVTEPK